MLESNLHSFVSLFLCSSSPLLIPLPPSLIACLPLHHSVFFFTQKVSYPLSLHSKTAHPTQTSQGCSLASLLLSLQRSIRQCFSFFFSFSLYWFVRSKGFPVSTYLFWRHDTFFLSVCDLFSGFVHSSPLSLPPFLSAYLVFSVHPIYSLLPPMLSSFYPRVACCSMAQATP